MSEPPIEYSMTWEQWVEGERRPGETIRQAEARLNRIETTHPTDPQEEA